MKKLLTATLILAAIYSCSLLADIKAYTVTWDANTEADLDGYELFVWQGLDSTLCLFTPGLLLTDADPTFYKELGSSDTGTTFIGPADGVTLISVAMNAFDFRHNRSGLTIGTVKDKLGQQFLLTIDNTPPSNPKNIEYQ